MTERVLLKARPVQKATGLPTLAEGTSVYVAADGNKPPSDTLPVDAVAGVVAREADDELLDAVLGVVVLVLILLAVVVVVIAVAVVVVVVLVALLAALLAALLVVVVVAVVVVRLHPQHIFCSVLVERHGDEKVEARLDRQPADATSRRRRLPRTARSRSRLVRGAACTDEEVWRCRTPGRGSPRQCRRPEN